jgi:hypothetical protein
MSAQCEPPLCNRIVAELSANLLISSHLVYFFVSLALQDRDSDLIDSLRTLDEQASMIQMLC